MKPTQRKVLVFFSTLIAITIVAVIKGVDGYFQWCVFLAIGFFGGNALEHLAGRKNEP